MKHPNLHVDGVDVTRLTGSSRRDVERQVVQSSAQHCIRTMVDYLGACASAAEPPRRIGEVAQQVVARSAALAAARQFIKDCEASD